MDLYENELLMIMGIAELNIVYESGCLDEVSQMHLGCVIADLLFILKDLQVCK